MLVVTVDCSTTHMNTDDEIDMEGILPNLLFGDGAGAVLITDEKEEGLWELNEPECLLMSGETASFINMRTRENGYYLNLSKDLVPSLGKALSQNWSRILKNLSKTSDTEEVEWLVHPGGKAILDTFTRLDPPLSHDHLRHSLKVMGEKGNLVSATLLFVLELMISQPKKNVACLIGPGPGLEVKFMSLNRV